MSRRRTTPSQSDAVADSVENTGPAPAISPSTWKIIVGLLMFVGVEFWLNAGLGSFGSILQPFVLAASILLGWVPRVQQPASRWFDRIRHPTPRARRMATWKIAIASSLYLLITALWQRRDFVPIMHDEFSYLIGAHILASGHLALAAHPLGYAFDSFQLLVDGVYASAYFQGLAVLYTPAIWLHLPPWGMSLLIAGAVVGLTYRVVTELIDGVAGAMAVLMLLAVQMFRNLSLMTMANTPLLLLGLLLVWAWLRWRQSDHRKAHWAIAMGAAAGWAAITRPVDALCFAIPVGIVILLDSMPKPARFGITTFGLLILGAMPFLSLQFLTNRQVTGHWFTTPFQVYADRDYPGSAFGFHTSTVAEPVSPIAQKRLVFAEASGEIRRHTPAVALSELFHVRVPTAFIMATPHALMLLLVPLGFFTLSDRRKWAVAAVVPLFFGFYLFYVFFLPHYSIILAPAIILIVLNGARVFGRTFPGAGKTAVGLTLGLGALSITNLPECGLIPRDEIFSVPLLADVNSKLAQVSGRAVVLFRFDAGRNLHEEPVFNSDVAWPDDARIIRAHDLTSDSNLKLARYYAKIQPDRILYRYDEADGSLTRLGTVSEIALANEPF